MNFQPAILEGLNEARRDSLYLSATDIQAGRTPVAAAPRRPLAAISAAIEGALAWLRITNRPATVTARPVSGR